MERRKAIAELPTAYAVALRMHDRQATDQEIADALDIPVESVTQLLEIGESKLRERCDRDRKGDRQPPT